MTQVPNGASRTRSEADGRPAERRAALRAALPERCVLSDPEDTRPYECDGLAAYRQLPMVVTLPDTEQQVLTILNICRALNVPIVPRGAGTGLSGGALPMHDGVVISTARLNRIVRVDPATGALTWATSASRGRPVDGRGRLRSR